MSTAVPAAKSALLASMQAAPGLSGVTVVRGKPDPEPSEFVSLWSAECEREYASLGQQRLDEEISLTVVVDVASAAGTDYGPAETRAWALFDAVEGAVRADLTLGGVWRFDRISKVRQEFFRQDRRRGCRVFLTITGKARI